MGLEALLRRAESVFDAPVVGVVGGLHYGNADAAALQPEIDLVQTLDPILVALSPHDSSTAVLGLFAQAFPDAYTSIRVGQSIHVPEIVAGP